MKIGAKIPPVLHSLLQFLTKSLAIVRAMLKEIFDESAYARYLERRGLTSSSESYDTFLRETEATRVRRPRCC